MIKVLNKGKEAQAIIPDPFNITPPRVRQCAVPRWFLCFETFEKRPLSPNFGVRLKI